MNKELFKLMMMRINADMNFDFSTKNALDRCHFYL